MDRDPDAGRDPEVTDPAEGDPGTTENIETPDRSSGRTPEVSPPVEPETGPAEVPPTEAEPRRPAQSDPPRQENPPRKDPPEESGGTITVVTCADTGMVAKDSCPEKSPRTYRKGRQPKRACTKH